MVRRRGSSLDEGDLPEFSRNGRIVDRSIPSSWIWIQRLVLFIFCLGSVQFLFYTDPIPIDQIHGGLMTNKSMGEFKTEVGNFIIEFLPEHAPKTVKGFTALINEGFFTQTTFYRSEMGELLQAGGFLTDKTSVVKSVPVEYSLAATERTVVLARRKDPYSGLSEFAIMLADNSDNMMPGDDGNPGYTTFGRVFSGWKTVQKIANKLPAGFLAKSDLTEAIPIVSAHVIRRLAPTEDAFRAVFQKVNDDIETEFSVVMFSKTTCPYCKKAKALLKQLHASVHVIEVNTLPNGPDVQKALEAISGRRTVPNIFVNGISIGGGDELADAYKEGTLQPLLEKAGVLAKGVLLDMIKKPVVVFSKSYCPFCTATKSTLASQMANPIIVELNERDDGAAIQHYLHELTGQRTVPNVFIGGKSLGGNDDVQRLNNSGELSLLLEKAGAI